MRELLAVVGVSFVEAPRLVRGLDYYVRTAFEVAAPGLGAQNALGGGGRYDGLVRDLGGPDVAGVGFALGIERLAIVLDTAAAAEAERPEFVVAPSARRPKAPRRGWRTACGAAARGSMSEPGGRSLKSQMRHAAKLGARYVIILGEDELDTGTVTVRDMEAKRDRASQPAGQRGGVACGAGGGCGADGTARMTLDQLGDWQRTDYCGTPRPADIGRVLTVMGWVHSRRDHGGVVFVDLRDRSGILQVVFNPEHSRDAHARAGELRGEY